VVPSGLGALTAATLGTGTNARAEPAPALQKVNVVIPTESVFVLNFNGARTPEGDGAGPFLHDGLSEDSGKCRCLGGTHPVTAIKAPWRCVWA
jgi:hypothetical protein